MWRQARRAFGAVATKQARLKVADGVCTVYASATIREAAKILKKNSASCLLVTDDGEHVAGILSERDVAYVDTRSSPVELSMTPVERLITVPEGEKKQLVNLMNNKKIRNVPVVNNKGQVTKVLTIQDLLKNLGDQFPDMRALPMDDKLKIERKKPVPTYVPSKSADMDNDDAVGGLRDLVFRLTKCLNENNNDYGNPDVQLKVMQILRTYKGEDWMKYVTYNEEMYTRNLVAKNEHVTLLLLVWPPGKKSPVHDHGGSQCFFYCLKGGFEEEMYDVIDDEAEPLRLKQKLYVSPGDVSFINDSHGIHAIGNPNKNVYSVSLHAYVPGYSYAQAYLDMNCAEDGKKLCYMQYDTLLGKPREKFLEDFGFAA